MGKDTKKSGGPPPEVAKAAGLKSPKPADTAKSSGAGSAGPPAEVVKAAGLKGGTSDDKEKSEKKLFVYTVKKGDSLSLIAKKLLGDMMRWPEIYELNKDEIENPDLIHPGQKFQIPRR